MRTARYILTLSFAGLASAVIAQSEPTLPHAELPHFDVVDADQDGFLSITEARKVFNNLTIEDTDGDGFVEKREAEDALPGLRYNNDTHEDDELRVGPDEYSLMAEQFLRDDIDEKTDE